MSDPKKVPVRPGLVPARQEIDVLNDDVSELDDFSDEQTSEARSRASGDRDHGLDGITVMDLPDEDEEAGPDGVIVVRPPG